VDFEASVVIGIRVADLVVKDQIAVECADHEIRERTTGFCFFDQAKDPKFIVIVSLTRLHSLISAR
jgi:hypothetical protein